MFGKNRRIAAGHGRIFPPWVRSAPRRGHRRDDCQGHRPRKGVIATPDRAQIRRRDCGTARHAARNGRRSRSAAGCGRVDHRLHAWPRSACSPARLCLGCGSDGLRDNCRLQMMLPSRHGPSRGTAGLGDPSEPAMCPALGEEAHAKPLLAGESYFAVNLPRCAREELPPESAAVGGAPDGTGHRERGSCDHDSGMPPAEGAERGE